jgi:hypothetical protein
VRIAAQVVRWVKNEALVGAAVPGSVIDFFEPVESVLALIQVV